MAFKAFCYLVRFFEGLLLIIFMLTVGIPQRVLFAGCACRGGGFGRWIWEVGEALSCSAAAAASPKDPLEREQLHRHMTQPCSG